MFKKRKLKLSLCIAVAAVFMLSVLPPLYARAVQEAQYAEAVMWYQEGDYEGALTAFYALGDYRDCIVYAARIETELAYQRAFVLLSNGDYEEAGRAFRALGRFKESEAKLLETERLANDVILSASWAKANELLRSGKYKEALEIFQALDHNYQYPQADEKAETCIRLLSTQIPSDTPNAR